MMYVMCYYEQLHKLSLTDDDAIADDEDDIEDDDEVFDDKSMQNGNRIEVKRT